MRRTEREPRPWSTHRYATCWQIDAARLRIGGRAWDDTFATILGAVAEGLGFRSGDLEARLYKLLVYPVGGFFAPHRDTEKVDRMVATLTISLPTAGAGGELVVRHGDRQEVVDMNAAEPSELAFAAFYADCSHETRPVRDGHRLSLVYNLCVLPGDTETSRHAPDYSAEAEAVARHLAEWRDERTGKLVWLLEHDYTAAGLSFDTLKNADNAVAHVLAAAAERAECALHAAIVHIEESGNAMYSDGDYVMSWDWRESDIEAMEIGDLYDSRHWLDGWIGADGSRPPFDEIPLLPEELASNGGAGRGGTRRAARARSVRQRRRGSRAELSASRHGDLAAVEHSGCDRRRWHPRCRRLGGGAIRRDAPRAD